MGGASGAGSLLLNTKALQEAACSRAPAAIVPGQEPGSRDAGMSGNAGIGSHLAAADTADGHAGQVDGPGSSGNAETGSHLAGADAAEGHARQVGGPGSSGNTGNGLTPGDALSPLPQHREGVVQSEGVVEGEAAVAGAA